MIPESIILHTSPDTRCQQCGDWRFANKLLGKHLYVTSVPLTDPRHRFLIQLHELIEAVLCAHRGITDDAVTEFDAQFELERADGLHSEADEDGDDPRAPYRKEHFTATNIERLMAAELGVDWKEYEQAITDYLHG